MNKWKYNLKLLAEFDHIIIPCSACIKPLETVIWKPCIYMPPGIDAIQFCPYPNPPVRSIDVYSLGRKSLVTHQALLKMAEERQNFYIYDTFTRMQTSIPREHRKLVANITKRSCYFIANAPKIDQPLETNGQCEISYRFLEGAASGTVMIGDIIENEAFRKHFDWPDVVIKVPFNAMNIADILDELDAQPERLEKIRKNNVVQCLLRHDWVYRWKTILELVGLKPKPALVAREERLKKLAEDIKKNS